MATRTSRPLSAEDARRLARQYQGDNLSALRSFAQSGKLWTDVHRRWFFEELAEIAPRVSEFERRRLDLLKEHVRALPIASGVLGSRHGK